MKATPTLERGRSAGSLGGRKILIVEDEFFIADELARAIHTLGGQVVGPVGTCAEGFELAKRAQIDLAVVDIGLAGETAYPLVDRLLADEVPVVFATGYVGLAVAPAYRHLPRWMKPYMPLALASALKHVSRP